MAFFENHKGFAFKTFICRFEPDMCMEGVGGFKQLTLLVVAPVASSVVR